MYASQISKDLIQWIKVIDRKGVIHSIFKSTINILCEDEKFIPIVVNNKPISPFSIKLDKIMDFTEMDLSIGEKIVFKADYLKGENITIDFTNAEIWDNSVLLLNNKDNLKNVMSKLIRLKEIIIEDGNKDGIFPLMQFISYELYYGEREDIDSANLFIKDRFVNFINAFKLDNTEEINKLALKIIGFGQGLTPSMDDFISGLMISNIYMSHLLNFNLTKSYQLNGEIVRDIDNKTTRVSEEMLKLFSIGEANEDIRNLMITLISVSTIDLGDIIKKVMDYGHSSGTDILCGIYIGSCILIEQYANSLRFSL